MSGLDGVEKTPPLQTHSINIWPYVPGDPDARQCLRLRDQSEATQVTVEPPGEGGSGTVALPPRRFPRKAGQEEGLTAASAAVAADHSLQKGVRGGDEAWTRGGADRDAPSPRQPAAVQVQGGPAEEQGAEEQMEVEAQPRAGEERDVAEEEAREEEGPWPLHEALRMDPLEAIQQELDAVDAQADRAFQHLEHRFGRMRRHYLERRNYIIQNIPGFWMTAFRNHPQLSAMIRGRDADMLRYVTNLEVKELRHPRTGCKFKFFFRRNPYFRNKLIVKEYEVRSSGRVVSLSTPIVWRRGHEPQSFIRRNRDLICSFFTWFSDHSLPESDKIAEIIKEDLWPNPLQYYLLREGVRRARRRPLREPVEIPRPFGFQSG
uniref:TSPY like 1 n=1 Tax=Saimiri boliviensis boliviensis TaxID=39432 RepID=A0A2K6U2J8_SAIBB